MTACTVATSETTQQSWEYEKLVPCGIVVGVDGSPESIAAFNAGARIARTRRCAFHAVSVIPPYPAYQIDPGVEASKASVDDLRLQLRSAALVKLMNAVDADPSWTHEVVIGRPAKAIVRIADERGAELILVGRTEHGVMDRIMGGETTLQIMRLSSIPVLAVANDSQTPHSAVVAVDFSEPSMRAAMKALELMRSGTLYLVHVEPLIVEQAPGMPSASAITRYPGDIVVWFRKFIEALKVPAGVIVETIILNGKPVPTLIEFSERVGAGMIAAGSHAHTRMERFLLGSVSTGLVRNASCPILVTPGQ